MKVFISVVLAFCVGTICFAQNGEPNGSGAAAPASASDVEALRQQVQSLSQMVQALQQQVKDQQAGVSKPDVTADPLPALPEASPTVTTSSSSAVSAAAPPLFPTTDDAVVASSKPAGGAPAVNANGAGTTFPTTDDAVTSNAAPASATTSTAGAGLTQPIQIAGTPGGRSYMNISFDALFAVAESSARDIYNVEVGDHDPQQRGFNARNAEIALDGAVDPFFEGFANIVLKLDNDNETEIELEEAFMQTTSLPFGLQAKGGQFFAPFGRINPTHPHTWDFADAPLVHGRLLGPDGLRGVGAQLSWTLPVKWYSQLTVAVQNGRGGTGYSFRNPGDNGVFYGRLTTDRELRGLEDFVWVPRWENSVDLGETQTVLGGVSGSFGSNETGGRARTQIYGADFLYKWKSARAEGGFPFVKWQTEAMYRRFEAGRGIDQTFPVAETFRDWGLYSQVTWGFKKGWVVGVRGEHLHMTDSEFTDDDIRQSRSRLTADLTWFPTEFSKLRLQYNHDFFEDTNFLAGRNVDSVFLQFEFTLGAHGAHKF